MDEAYATATVLQLAGELRVAIGPAYYKRALASTDCKSIARKTNRTYCAFFSVDALRIILRPNDAQNAREPLHRVRLR